MPSHCAPCVMRRLSVISEDDVYSEELLYSAFEIRQPCFATEEYEECWKPVAVGIKEWGVLQNNGWQNFLKDMTAGRLVSSEQLQCDRSTSEKKITGAELEGTDMVNKSGHILRILREHLVVIVHNVRCTIPDSDTLLIINYSFKAGVVKELEVEVFLLTSIALTELLRMPDDAGPANLSSAPIELTLRVRVGPNEFIAPLPLANPFTSLFSLKQPKHRRDCQCFFVGLRRELYSASDSSQDTNTPIPSECPSHPSADEQQEPSDTFDNSCPPSYLTAMKAYDAEYLVKNRRQYFISEHTILFIVLYQRQSIALA
ncbi:hypothetical protein EV421DRAFT_1738675 [Armillaria borealis]|uniref:Uncharacterized protein n=1 Tax=Armillaria borealis TaxID=47425 RepID=A0AA39J983_9AGAR|nr:hypothetical protein EV421DRAFT_1738675 [Armillaria borealis]